MNKNSRPRLKLVERSAFQSDPLGVRGELPSSPDSTAALPPTPAEPNWANVEAEVRQGRRAQLSTLLEMPDKHLVALALSGEGLAREALYRKHAAFAIRLATRIEGSSRDVEDIVHDAFIKVLTRLEDLTEPAAFRSWLGSIVVFAVRSRMRRARLMNVLGLGRTGDPVDLDALASPSASPHVRAQLAQIYALLRTLPTDERIAWTLRCVDGNELEVVARLTSCSLATVKRRISRVQKFLEEHFVDSTPESKSDWTNTDDASSSIPDPADDDETPRTAPRTGATHS
jgi:RNA polymerase sigma-70 factor, ECF subfamily